MFEKENILDTKAMVPIDILQFNVQLQLKKLVTCNFTFSF